MQTYYLYDHLPILPKAEKYWVIEGVPEEEVAEILKSDSVLGRGFNGVVSGIRDYNLNLLLSYRLDVGIPSYRPSNKINPIFKSFLILVSAEGLPTERIQTTDQILGLADTVQLSYAVIDLTHN